MQPGEGVRATLEELKLADNTLVVFTSDNGPETLKSYPGARCPSRRGRLTATRRAKDLRLLVRGLHVDKPRNLYRLNSISHL